MFVTAKVCQFLSNSVRYVLNTKNLSKRVYNFNFQFKDSFLPLQKEIWREKGIGL